MMSKGRVRVRMVLFVIGVKTFCVFYSLSRFLTFLIFFERFFTSVLCIARRTAAENVGTGPKFLLLCLLGIL